MCILSRHAEWLRAAIAVNVVGFVPSKLNSRRLPQKNVLSLGGTPLINHVLRTLTGVEMVDDVVVYASDDVVMGYIEDDLIGPVRFVSRPPELDRDDAKVQDFVGGFLRDVDAEIVVLLHATSPFITTSTVEQCLAPVLDGTADSAFAALRIQRFAWFEGRPLNYSPSAPTPRTQDLVPVVIEQSGLYVFTRELFETTQRRLGTSARAVFVDDFEGHDIDTKEEFDFAKLIHSHRSD